MILTPFRPLVLVTLSTSGTLSDSPPSHLWRPKVLINPYQCLGLVTVPHDQQPQAKHYFELPGEAWFLSEAVLCKCL